MLATGYHSPTRRQVACRFHDNVTSGPRRARVYQPETGTSDNFREKSRSRPELQTLPKAGTIENAGRAREVPKDIIAPGRYHWAL